MIIIVIKNAIFETSVLIHQKVYLQKTLLTRYIMTIFGRKEYRLKATQRSKLR